MINAQNLCFHWIAPFSMNSAFDIWVVSWGWWEQIPGYRRLPGTNSDGFEGNGDISVIPAGDGRGYIITNGMVKCTVEFKYLGI